MRVPSLSLLYAATWLASTTVFALVARHSTHQARSGLTAEYPQGQDAKTCPLDSARIDLQLAEADSDALRRLAGVLSTAPTSTSTSSMTRRDLTADELSQVCREVGRFPFAPHHNPGRFLPIYTSVVQPGLYVVSVQASMVVRTLTVSDTVPPHDHLYYLARNNQHNYIRGQFQIRTPVRLHIWLNFWWPDVAGGEIALFRLGPRGYRGPSSQQKRSGPYEH